MPAVNPTWICQPCARGNHRWCTLEKICRCMNAWDGEGWRENVQRQEARKAVQRLTKFTPRGLGASSRVRPLVGGAVVWSCADCGFESPYWKGCERFKYCTDCERRHLEVERRQLAELMKEQGAAATEDASTARRGGGQGDQQPLPLAAHRDGKQADSPCDKKDPASA